MKLKISNADKKCQFDFGHIHMLKTSCISKVCPEAGNYVVPYTTLAAIFIITTTQAVQRRWKVLTI